MSALRHNLDCIAHSLKAHGLEHVVVSPGSRNAPLIAAFLRVEGFTLVSATDERSAAFIALGISEATSKAAAVICTSGTAVLNLYPGICEAYYQRIPLLVLTADRPAENIDKWDGQTIHQKNIFEKHIGAQYETPQNLHIDQLAAVQELCASAMLSTMEPHGAPVHINIPIAEPIYEGIDAPLEPMPEIQSAVGSTKNIENVPLPEVISHSKRILIIAGQMQPDAELQKGVGMLGLKIPIVADITSNLHNVVGLQYLDSLLTQAAPNFLPEVLVTIGMSVISKPLKKWVRDHKPAAHFHIAASGWVGDLFDTQPEVVRTNPSDFLHQMLSLQPDPEYRVQWVHGCREAKSNYAANTEFSLVRNILSEATEETAIQLGNSMPVRWANVDTTSKAGSIWSNRGTSGIDGSLSTAVGFALGNPNQKVVCILGDISFLYDVHGLWCDPLPHNLKIVVINNGMGAIFDHIDGPNRLPALRKYVHTPHQNTLELLAQHYKVPYTFTTDLHEVNAVVKQVGLRIIEFNSTK
jgi:2-succinyl-5-enolpyruvyl-6-hydroxy-3-cyclohexene-1-carboxylate synthase